MVLTKNTEAKIKELLQHKAAGDALQAELDMEEKKIANLAVDAKKREVNMIRIAIFCPEGHVARCQLPTAAVIQLGLFRLLGGDKIDVSSVVDKLHDPNSTITLSNGKGTDMTAQDAHWVDTPDAYIYTSNF